MVKKLSKATKSHAPTVTKPPRKAALPDEGMVMDEEERILREATKHLVFKHGMFLVASGLRETRIKGFRVWIIAVTLRYAKGDEAYIGELLYDGDEFTFLTEQSIMHQRAQKLANDPERIRKWNEYRTSALHTGKA